jgi:coatomer subunit beta'
LSKGRETFGVQIEDRVRTGLWVGDCFIYNNGLWRLNYCVAGEVTVMYHLDRPMYLLGYLAAQQRVYLLDKQHTAVSYTLLLSLVEFKTLVMRGELEEAFRLLDTIPKDQLDGYACFCPVFFSFHCSGCAGV